MSVSGNAALTEARRWIGTPYVHQASVKGAGTDCLGLLRGVWRHLYGQEPETVPAYSADWAEPQKDEVLWAAAQRHLQVKPLTDAAPGDVLLFRMRRGGIAKHVGLQGFIGTAPSFVHAFAGHAVLESPFSSPWRRRVVARFEFPEKVM